MMYSVRDFASRRSPAQSRCVQLKRSADGGSNSSWTAEADLCRVPSAARSRRCLRSRRSSRPCAPTAKTSRSRAVIIIEVRPTRLNMSQYCSRARVIWFCSAVLSKNSCRISAYLRMVGLASCGGDLGGSKSGLRPMPILAPWFCGAGCRVGAASGGSFQNGVGVCRVQAEEGARQCCSTWSGCGELEFAQGVECAFADLAGDGQSGHGGVASLAGGAVEGEVGGGCAVRVHGGFDERPAQMR